MSHEDQRLQDLVQRFERACEGGDAIDLEKYLPAPEDPLRARALQALIAVDLDVCWRGRRQMRLEDYLPRFPELGTARTVAVALIVAEYRARSQHGDRPSRDVYQRRFPDQFAEVVKRLDSEAAPLTASVAANPVRASVEAPHTPPPSGPSFVPLTGGYKLLKRIGYGGFAEVWEAEAPGGFPVAVKIILRSLEHDEAQRELKALEVVRRLRHNHLLQTQAAWVQDGRLYVAMELADGSLRDRLKECRRAGLPGVAVKDLLKYLREAAEALDYLHGEKVQHRDIKPDNILLLSGHAKVADFGLARLQDKQLTQSVTGSGTPAYMPPEVWAGKLHRNSDQYSLAVTYAELRLDRRPFTGSSPLELMMSHRDAKPDLAPLSSAEQQALLRALSPVASERYGSCLEFVRALDAVAPEDIEPPHTRLSGEIPPPARRPESRQRSNMSGLPTDENSSLAAVPRPRPGPRSNSNWRRTPVLTPPKSTWHGQRTKTVLPFVILLLLGVPMICGLALTLLGRMPWRPNPSIITRRGEVAGLPPVFERAADATDVIDRGKTYPSRIELKLPDAVRVPFVFVPQDAENQQPRGADVGPFYIMVNKVSYDLFHLFAVQGQRPLLNNAWQKPPGDGRCPVTAIIADDAAHCAIWLRGKLPTKQEWDKAAGLYQEHPGERWDTNLGPFSGKWDKILWQTNGVPDVAIFKPAPVGEAKDDESCFHCRDMAGNGLELTRTLQSTDEQVPLGRPAGKDDRVIVRGNRFELECPTLFADLERDDKLRGVPYQQPRDVSFRVVIDEFDDLRR
jgi:serine/threonine protein kinase